MNTNVAMERQQLCHRFVVVRLVLLLHAFCCAGLLSRRSILVESFVLRSGPSIAQLADAVDLNDDADMRQGDDDDEDDGSFVSRLSPMDLERLTDEVKYQSPTGYEVGPAADEFTPGDENDESAATLADLVMETVNQNDGTAARYTGIYDDDDQQDVDDINDEGEDAEDQPWQGGLTTLNKSELHQLFDQTQADDATSGSESKTSSLTESALDVIKKSELTKNEVEQLFERSADAEQTDAKQPESLSLAPVVVVTTGSGNTSLSSGDELVVVPTVKVTTVQELVKNVDQGRADGIKEKPVTLDVKEEKILPGTNEKTTKEWMIELERPDDDDMAATATSAWMVGSGGSKGSKKFKRSPQVDDSELPSMTFEQVSDRVAKSRAVELLKTYIQLQEDENRHLTQALKMATRGQTERSDIYIGSEIEHLKQAVKDEKALETVRDLIRAEEANKDGDDEDDEEEEAEEEPEDDGDISRLDDDDDEDDNNVDTNEYTTDDSALIYGVKRGLLGDDLEDLEVREPSMLSFGGVADRDADENEDEQMERENDDDEFFRDELRQYILQKQLDSTRQSVNDAAGEADADNDWTPDDGLPSSKSSRTTYRESVRLNPFTRDIEDLYQNRGLALKKRQNIDVLGYEDEPARGRVPPEDDELAEARQEIADAVALARILQPNPTDDDDDDDANEFIEQLTRTEMCPAVQELTDNCLVARERGLVLDAEALQLCSRHQLCYSCGIEHGLTPEICDRGYLSEADRLCTRGASSGHGRSRCKTEATGLYVIMLDGHRYHSAEEPGYMPLPVCRHRCTYDFIVGSTSGR